MNWNKLRPEVNLLLGILKKWAIIGLRHTIDQKCNGKTIQSFSYDGTNSEESLGEGGSVTTVNTLSNNSKNLEDNKKVAMVTREK